MTTQFNHPRPNRVEVLSDCFSKEFPLIEGSDAMTKVADRTSFGVETVQVYFRVASAPACCIATREVVRGTALQRLLPVGSFYKGKGGEFDLINSPADCIAREPDWLGLQSRVYLLDCFNYNRVAEHFGFRTKDVVEMIYGREPNPLDQMRKHPLKVVKLGWFLNNPQYTLVDDSGVQAELWDGVILVPCTTQ